VGRVIDFYKLDIGAIRTTDGKAILILGGKMYGPFSRKELRRVREILEDPKN
jgi:hypothetical protein